MAICGYTKASVGMKITNMFMIGFDEIIFY